MAATLIDVSHPLSFKLLIFVMSSIVSPTSPHFREVWSIWNAFERGFANYQSRRVLAVPRSRKEVILLSSSIELRGTWWSRLHVVSSRASISVSPFCWCISDDGETKSGFKSACTFINSQMTQFFKGKELPLSKKVFDQLANWVDRQRTRLAS